MMFETWVFESSMNPKPLDAHGHALHQNMAPTIGPF
jgi:hypothetical protein